MDLQTLKYVLILSGVIVLLILMSLIDIAKKEFKSTREKILWWAIASIPVIGWLIYLLFGFWRGKKPVEE
ncbi:MAG: PLDc N-terminal domain-containing protein [Dissulfuribacterales bacterium]